MNTALRFATTILGVLLLAGCSIAASDSSRQLADADPSARAPARSVGVRLPAGATLKLPREPGSGMDGLMMDGVYSLVSDGITVIAIAGRPERADVAAGPGVVATPLRIVEVLQGVPSADEVVLLAGVPELQLAEGVTYLLVLGADSESKVEHSYTLGSATSLLDPADDGTWVSRDKSVTVTLNDVRDVLARSAEHLASRSRAGEAHLTIAVQPMRDGYQATVAGYALGESLGIKVCLASEDPQVPPRAQSCDAAFGESVTPGSAEQRFEFTPPSEISSSPEASTPCDGTCVLFVYDLDWPSKVFATAPIS